MIRVFNQYVSSKGLLCAVCECLLTVLALLCGGRMRFWTSPAEFETFRRMPEFGLQVLLFVACVGVCFYYNDLYDLSILRGRRERLLDLAQALGAAALLLGMAYFLVPDLTIGRGVWFISMAFIMLFVVLHRTAMETVWQAAPRQNALILGTGALAMDVPRQMAVLAAAIRLESRGPAIFRQERVGYRSRRFQVLKFRSMRVDAEAAGARWAVVDDPRLTRLGRWLRKCHLDELPQFVNVLRGDM